MEKEGFKFSIPRELRFGIIWTLFFTIVGIAIQSFQANILILADFFSKNYIDWIKIFTNSAELSQQLFWQDQTLLQVLLERWYYLFYTGGLLALIWGILHWLINLEISFKNRNKAENTQITLVPSSPVQENRLPAKAEIEKALEAGAYMLSQGNLQAAKDIYGKIKSQYNPNEDKDGKIYRRILDFYSEIVEESSPKKKQQEEWEG